MHRKISSKEPVNASVPGDDDASEDGVDEVRPLVSGVQTGEFTVGAGAAPISSGVETGYDSNSDDSWESSSDLTIDLGFAPKPLHEGNLVFRDLNADGKFTEGTD